MALQGKGDARWVVRERDDGRNVNSWHWVDKNVSTWAQARLRELLSPAECAAAGVAVESVDTVDGDATLYNRKGVLKVLYDLKVVGKWTTPDADNITTGAFSFELFDDDPDVSCTVDAKSHADPACKAAFIAHVVPLIREKCKVFTAELHAGAGDSLDGVVLPALKKAPESESKVTDYLRSGMDQKPRSAAGTPVGGVQLKLEDVFMCSTNDLFLALTDRARLEAITRARVVSEPTVGGAFSLLQGTASGVYTKLTPGEGIQMQWRLKTWGDDAVPASVSINLSDDEGKAKLELVAEGVPKAYQATTEGFWRVQIFQAMKVVMGWGSASRFL